MNEQLEKDFLSKIDSLRDKTNVLHFSTGADAVASYLRLREFDIKPILCYHYFGIKDLFMVKNYIDWFEKKFNENVYQYPSTLFSEMFDRALFQYPIKARERFRNRIGYNLAGHTKEKFDKFLQDTIGGDVVFHFGLKYTDGLHRYRHLMQHGCSFGNKFYPVAPFQVKDIQAILEKNDCLLPIDYRLYGMSFESPRAWNINLIKEHCPETYRQICDMFPLIGAEGLRDKYTKLSKHHKQRITQYGNYAMPKEGLTW
ncbi:MAG: hypothetical protein LBH07_01190 [Treponema sp.]|jgi:hypothetical protein|nr:hypothetical protein [Treponema sp.]